ncbi:MAG: sigma-70 family RNA polymerase sigma factor [Alphaproteobacteria bacterium]|nr:sigma-70 family RNA polymerase sigma factor [Alphaproteobacteria bacterium]
MIQPPAPEDGDALFEEVYAYLRNLAAHMHGERGARPEMDPTSLVHEAWTKMKQGQPRWESKRHFAALAARAMRQVLIDRARRRASAKRGGGWERVSLAGLGTEQGVLDIVALDRALTELAAHDEVAARIVELKLLGGLQNDEIGESLSVSLRTVERKWRSARAWLLATLAD